MSARLTAMTPDDAPPLMEVRDLRKTYALARGQTLKAVDGISQAVMAGGGVGRWGGSGCGQSTRGRCLLRLMDVTSGQIMFEGRDITALGERALRPLRPRMQMVFQDSYASLNPRRRIGDLLAEPLRVHPDAGGRRRSAAVGAGAPHLKREHLHQPPAAHTPESQPKNPRQPPS
ncbi:MAG: ATP-binding cassette domain-containing protein, partial [Novacetimonas hansenii]|uniref:ATP-binding cassette domain-containing protein n=1 Tax=Novacetimonas hansenii TaxID=436 RepID=UPI0039E8FAB7